MYGCSNIGTVYYVLYVRGDNVPKPRGVKVSAKRCNVNVVNARFYIGSHTVDNERFTRVFDIVFLSRNRHSDHVRIIKSFFFFYILFFYRFFDTCILLLYIYTYFAQHKNKTKNALYIYTERDIFPRETCTEPGSPRSVHITEHVLYARPCRRIFTR